MDDLRAHPQIEELIETLDQNEMHKEKAEVESLMDYIGDMEKTLADMLKEMQGMRKEIDLIHSSTLRAKCLVLVEKTEGGIRQAVAVVVKVKDNLIDSAKKAVKAFKEKGRDAYIKAVRAMKVPETLDKLAGLFAVMSKDTRENAKQLVQMQSELNIGKAHFKNVARLFAGRQTKDLESVKADKGVLSGIGKTMERIGKGFEGLAQKAMDKADKIRAAKVRESVKDTLDALKGIPGGRVKDEPYCDR